MPLLQEGVEAPAFALKNHDGITTELAQFRGHYVVLWW